MKNNLIQFGVVREDPEIEFHVVQKFKSESILLIGSGGCTAFSLQCRLPDLKISLFDLNPAQIELVKTKAELLKRPLSSEAKVRLGVGSDSPSGLCTGGNFESLFRGFREFLIDFAADGEDFTSIFSDTPKREQEVNQLLSNKYWPVAFELFFSDVLLTTLFGPSAIQHAQKGSYPEYFRKALEKGLKSSGASTNYFLHHIFLGYYLDSPAALPYYLQKSPHKYSFSYHLGDVTTVKNLDSYGVISLSNIFDWMGTTEIRSTADYLTRSVKPGTAILWRQLGHDVDASHAFGSDWVFDKNLAGALLESDRSLFYSRIYLAVRK